VKPVLTAATLCVALGLANLSTAGLVLVTPQHDETVPVMGSPIATTTPTVVKIKFESFASANLSLCVGSLSDVLANVCATRLTDSGGPGYPSLAIVDINAYAGEYLYVHNNSYTAVSNVEYLLEIE
jgi:hypothetical protein